MPEITGDRIFLFKGRDGQGGAETTHEELKNWITSKLPPIEKRAGVNNVDYDKYISEALNSENEARANEAKKEVEAL